MCRALTAILLLIPFVLSAQNREECEYDREPAGSAVWKNERNFNAVNDAWELIAAEKYRDAEATLTGLVDKFSDPYERSQAQHALGAAKMSLEKYDQALRIYEQIIQGNALTNRAHYDAIYQIAQLHYFRENYQRAVEWLDRWFAETCEIKPDAYVMRASIRAQQDRYRDAIVDIKKAISLSDDPKESWYQLLLASHYELKQFPEAADVLELLVRKNPEKKQYWVQLASIYVTLKQEQKALAVLALAHRKGMLTTKTDLRQLFSLYGYLEIPYQAALVMEEGIEKGIFEPNLKNLESLGNAWYAAYELDKSIAALSRAAGMSNEGKLHMQVAYILVDQEKWEEAREELSEAVRKGGLSPNQTGNMLVLLGTAEANLKNWGAAREAFRRAMQYDSVRRAAQEWLAHMEELQQAT